MRTLLKYSLHWPKSIVPLTVLCMTGTFGIRACGGDITLDLEGPAHGAVEGRWPEISRVQVYIGGPEQGFESGARVRDLLSKSPVIEEVFSKSPVYVGTNSNEIHDLTTALHKCDVEGVNVNVLVGYTHHIVLFEPGSNKVMHFRVFSQDLNTKTPASVYPSSDTGFGYTSADIIP